MSGPQQLLPWLTQFQPADTPERFEAFVSRLHAYPAYLGGHIETLAEGLASGLTVAAHRRRADDRPDRADARDPARPALVPSMVKVASEADRERIRDIVRDVVTPADVAFLDALKGDYLAASREDPGIWSAPDGEALYRTAIRSWTSLDLDPSEVHAIGMAQLETHRGRASRDRAGGRLRRRHGRVSRRRSATTRPTSPARRTSSWTGRRGHRARDGDRAAVLRRPAPGRTARSAPVEEYKEKDAPFAYYYPPKPGRHARRDLLRERLRPAEPQVHEARLDDLPRGGARPPLPDHARDREPAPQRVPPARAPGSSVGPTSRAGACTASGSPTRWASIGTRASGSGCSTRRRGGPAGSSSTPGMHALRWPRQRSIDFLQAAGLSETDAVIETDRYICWPGQALTYMIGQLEIQRLRAELEARDGSGFDLRAFHDAVLGHGRCRSRRSRANSRTGWRPRSERARRRPGKPLRVEADPERVQRS